MCNTFKELAILVLMMFLVLAASNAYAKCDAKIGTSYKQYKNALKACDTVAKDTFGKGKFIQENYSGGYDYWEKYNGISTEVNIWADNGKVVKSQRVLTGSEVNTVAGAKKVFNDLKNKFDNRFGVSNLLKASDGQVAMWDTDNIAVALSLELPQTKFGLPIVKIVEVLKGYAERE